MIENDLDKVLNYMKRYVENVYEHDSEIMLNWKDIKLVLEEIERLNNIINELECWLRKNLQIEEKNDLQICLNKLEQLKNKKIYGSSKYEVVYFGEALGSDKE